MIFDDHFKVHTNHVTNSNQALTTPKADPCCLASLPASNDLLASLSTSNNIQEISFVKASPSAKNNKPASNLIDQVFETSLSEATNYGASNQEACIAVASHSKSDDQVGLTCSGPCSVTDGEKSDINLINKSLFTSTLISKASSEAQQTKTASVYLPTCPVAGDLHSGLLHQMISSDNIYTMAPAPVFVTPSGYPQVTVIPEGDLLRSMIVQDVKQVTQRLLDKNSKKKRGKRNRKEKVMPGNFGTLKVNFKKFFTEQPPMVEPAPKKTVYQRIAPRYPVTFTESAGKQSHVIPAEKTQGSLSSCKGKQKIGGTKQSASRLSKREAETLSQKSGTSLQLTGKSFESNPEVIYPEVTDAELVHPEIIQASDNIETSFRPAIGSQADVFINDLLYHTQSGLAFTETNQQIVYSDSNPNTAVTTYTHVPVMTTSVGDRTRDLAMTEIWPTDGLDRSARDFADHSMSASDPRVSSSTPLSTAENMFCSVSMTGVTPVNSGCLSPVFGTDVCVNSPDVIGSELNTLLSELYTEFSSALYDKMDIVSCTGGAAQSTASIDTVEHSTVNTAAVQPFNTTLPPVSNSSLLNNHVSLEPTMEVVDETCTFEANALSNTIDGIYLMQEGDAARSPGPIASIQTDYVIASNNNIEMEVDLVDVDANESRDLVEIIDISPEYASSEGGGKIILIGSWNNKAARYSCRFGDTSVAADLIQNGVLRCFCPANKPGKVQVVVLCGDAMLSKSVDFEYVDTEEDEGNPQDLKHDWLEIEEDALKQLLIERIEALCDIADSTARVQGLSAIANGVELEDALTGICEALSTTPVNLPADFDYKCEEVMTVLHLSAALGYTKLIQVLCSWVERNSNAIISQEANPCKQDQFMLTPLMWACAKGKFDTVCVLLQWDDMPSQIADGCGCTPLSISRDQGHTILERYLQKSQAKGHSR